MDALIELFRSQVVSAHHVNAVAAPVVVPGDEHATPPTNFMFVKELNVALAKQLHATDPSRTEADRADPRAWEKYLPVARERLRPRAVGPPVQWRRRAHLRR